MNTARCSNCWLDEFDEIKLVKKGYHTVKEIKLLAISWLDQVIPNEGDQIKLGTSSWTNWVAQIK